MTRTTAMISTLAASLLCGLPGLSMLALFAYSSMVNPQQAVMMAGGRSSVDTGASMGVAQAAFILAGLILIAIPVVVGILTLRLGKEQTA